MADGTSQEEGRASAPNAGRTGDKGTGVRATGGAVGVMICLTEPFSTFLLKSCLQNQNYSMLKLSWMFSPYFYSLLRC